MPRLSDTRLKRKLKHNKSGISSILTAMIVIIIVIVMWEVIGQFYPNIFKPSDIFAGEGDVTAEMYIFDRVTGEQTLMNEGTPHGIVQAVGHSYTVVLKSNVPFKIFSDPYRWVYVYWNEDYYWSERYDAGNLTAVSQTIPFNAMWSNTFNFNVNASNLYNTLLDFRLYSPTGIELFFWDIELTHSTGYGNFP